MDRNQTKIIIDNDDCNDFALGDWYTWIMSNLLRNLT